MEAFNVVTRAINAQPILWHSIRQGRKHGGDEANKSIWQTAHSQDTKSVSKANVMRDLREKLIYDA